MISWIGTIFSALSLAFQLKNQKDKSKYNLKIIEISKQTVEKAAFVKDIHGFFQEIFYEEYEKYLNSFGKSTPDIDKRLWGAQTKKYNQYYKRYNLDVTMGDEIAKISYQYNGSDINEIDAIIESIGVDKNIKVLNSSYPVLIKNISKLNSLLIEYSEFLKLTGGFYTNKHGEMEKLFIDILFDADRCLKELIEVLYRIMKVV